MNADAIQVVSAALAQRLKDAIATADHPKIEGEVFVGPLDDQNAKDKALVVFLYRVGVNADLRNSRHTLPPAADGGPLTVYDGSLPLDLHYLITAGSEQANNELDTLRTLGFALQTLNDSPILVGQGEVVRLSLESVSCEELSRIWTLFPTANYRTSVVFVATPVWVDPARINVSGAPVVREPHKVGQIDVGAARG